ncbi:glycosyltransferase family 2 protein, partial [Achromobacter ruhlandii]|nr:glycosyltransferase family 2 protein [Achromobacter ruhlandii]
ATVGACARARRRSSVGGTRVWAGPEGCGGGVRHAWGGVARTVADAYFRCRIRGEKLGCVGMDIVRKVRFPGVVGGFVPESLVWGAIARAGYLSRFINQVVRTYHDTPGGLSQGAVSVGNNAQGLYLLAWDMLQHHLEFFRFRPREFVMAAARYTRFRLHLKHSGVPTAVQAYRLTNPWARLMVGVMWPLGYALYRRDRRRGVA